MQMAISMKANGRMAKRMDLVSTSIPTGLVTTEIGLKTNRVAKDMKLGPMEPCMKVSTSMERKMVKEF